MPRSSTAWKNAERKFAKFLGGIRHPSQGVSHEDLSGDWFTGEHKYGDLSTYPAFFRHVINQIDENKHRFPSKVPLGCFTFHSGRGIRNRAFLLVEVDLDKDGTILKESLEKVRYD